MDADDKENSIDVAVDEEEICGANGFAGDEGAVEGVKSCKEGEGRAIASSSAGDSGGSSSWLNSWSESVSLKSLAG